MTSLGVGRTILEGFTEASGGISDEVAISAPSYDKKLVSLSNVPRLLQSDLYPVRQAFNPQHIAALRLLKVAMGRTQRGLSALREGDVVAADSEVQKIQVLLPELFCCRALGDGFATIINALMSAFESLDGSPLDEHQLITVNDMFAMLRDKPFLSVEEAEQQLDQMEAAQLNPYPKELLDFLSNGESVR